MQIILVKIKDIVLFVKRKRFHSEFHSHISRCYKIANESSLIKLPEIKIIEDSGSIEFTNNKTMILFLLAITFSCYFFISSATTSKRLKTPDISLTSLLEVNPFIKSDRSIKASMRGPKQRKQSLYAVDPPTFALADQAKSTHSHLETCVQ